jgi:hypothetical protein
MSKTWSGIIIDYFFSFIVVKTFSIPLPLQILTIFLSVFGVSRLSSSIIVHSTNNTNMKKLLNRVFDMTSDNRIIFKLGYQQRPKNALTLCVMLG